MAWLHATPRPPAGSTRAKDFDLVKAVSRLEQMKQARVDPTMPPNPMPHIIDRLTEIGLTGSNGMSATALPWSDINDWQTATHVRLSPWEARLIRRLSLAYVGESRKAEDETCPPPWRDKVTEAAKAAEIAILDAVLD